MSPASSSFGQTEHALSFPASGRILDSIFLVPVCFQPSSSSPTRAARHGRHARAPPLCASSCRATQNQHHPNQQRSDPAGIVGSSCVDTFYRHQQQMGLVPDLSLCGPLSRVQQLLTAYAAQAQFIPRQHETRSGPGHVSICFFPARIAKWCCEIRQALRMPLCKL
ncbi:uncharacterized protein LOC124672585 [Lolium rigidum]|uniref:uncharacterized protein LOC124672585 n=1 Tax=Lolium rigidum TaxID=89674 RepID=UPI001F5CE7FD|nr:uncharacterized protein LOC124672585 [Lolium rigidum]